MVYRFTHFLYSQKHEAWDDDLQDDAFRSKAQHMTAAPPLVVTLTTNYLKTDFRFKFCFKKTQSVLGAGTSRV